MKAGAMARYCISKGDMDKDGNRILVSHILDADNRWNETVFERVPEAKADARMEELISGGRFERWPPAH
jgi:hypothetical protein